MLRAEQLAQNQGQQYVVFTGDLQIYRIAVQIGWDNPERFSVFLGARWHAPSQEFGGSIGTLLEYILGKAFSSAKKIMSGK